MATKTFEELKQLAIQIRDEKTNKQNTAPRVGTAMLEHINKLEQDYYDKTQTDEELKERDDKLTELSGGINSITNLVKGITYTNSDLKDGSYRIGNAVVGSEFTGSPFNDATGRIKIEVLAGSSILLKTYGASSPVKGLWNGYVLTNKDNICVVKVTTSEDYNTLDDGAEILVEQDGYLYVSCNNEYRDRFSLELRSIGSGVLKTAQKQNQEYTESAIEKLGNTTLLEKFQPFLLTVKELNFTSGYINGQGVLTPHGSVSATDFISITPDTEYLIKNHRFTGATGSYYDKNKEFIGNITGLPSSTTETQDATITTRNGAYFMRLNAYNSQLDIFAVAKVGFENNYMLKDLIVGLDQVEGNVESGGGSSASIRFNRLLKPFPLEAGKKLLAFGDSITVGVQSSSRYSFANEGDYKYIQVLAEQFGWTLINRAASGQKSDGMLSSVKAYSGDIPDIIYIAIGTNDFQVAEYNAQLGSYADVLDSPSENTYYGRLDAAVKFLKEKYPLASIILQSPINFVGKSMPNNINKFRNAVQFVATINGVSFIDGECIGFPNVVNSYSNVVIADNCHPTSYGHLIYGLTVASLLR
jgi:hypothetical protein|nr:MAG TPA: hypothetical protein [Caudoviricetes sp.]